VRNPFFTTVSGIEVDLVHPRVEDVALRDVAHHLSMNCRYGCACRYLYTVAEHLIRGLHLCDDSTVRRYWLAHDMHEYVHQDDTTPKKKALPIVMAEMLGEQFPLADVEKFQVATSEAHEEFERRHMRAVHLACGLEWPVPEAIARAVKRIDRKMLLEEWANLMPGSVPDEYLRLDGDLMTPANSASSRAFNERMRNAVRDQFAAAVSMILPKLSYFGSRA
jgi:hypothetical protein